MTRSWANFGTVVGSRATSLGEGAPNASEMVFVPSGPTKLAAPLLQPCAAADAMAAAPTPKIAHALFRDIVIVPSTERSHASRDTRPRPARFTSMDVRTAWSSTLPTRNVPAGDRNVTGHSTLLAFFFCESCALSANRV